MTIEYLIRTLIILSFLASSIFFCVRIRKLTNWVKHEDFFHSDAPAMRNIPCHMLNEIRRLATHILFAVSLVCILEYGWMVYRYVSPPTPYEYFAYSLATEISR